MPGPKMFQLDHIVVAAPDLSAAKAAFERDTGMLPVDGGAHVGLGTRNALASFGGGQYLEIIAPDPEQDTRGNFGGALAELQEPQLLHWAVRVEGLANTAQQAQRCGFEPGEIRRTSRALPNGEVLVWELMGLGGHADGGLLPFFIDWLECPHPADSVPRVGALTRFELALPAGHGGHELLTGCECVDLQEGVPSLSVRFDSARGERGWDANRLAGFRL